MSLSPKETRIIAALEHLTSENSVMVISLADWQKLVREDGMPTVIERMFGSANGIMQMASLVTVAGSGIVNQNPGIAAVRLDENDAPNIYNIYHFKVFENLPDHQIYKQATEMAGVEDDEELRSALRDNVFIVSDKRENEHWYEQIPEQIKSAKSKE